MSGSGGTSLDLGRCLLRDGDSLTRYIPAQDQGRGLSTIFGAETNQKVLLSPPSVVHSKMYHILGNDFYLKFRSILGLKSRKLHQFGKTNPKFS